MLVNKTVEFFLSEAARRARCRRGLGLGWQRANHRGWQRARSEMPVGRNRVAAGRDGSGQMLGVPRLGSEWPGTGRDAGGKINSKESAL